MDKRNTTINWTPFELEFDRKIVAIQNNIITVDTAITNAIDEKWGGGYIYVYHNYRIENVGIEQLQLVSSFDPSKKCTLR